MMVYEPTRYRNSIACVLRKAEKYRDDKVNISNKCYMLQLLTP